MQKLTVSVTEAAALLGIGRNTTYELVKLKRLPALKLGKRILIPRLALEKLLGEVPKAA